MKQSQLAKGIIGVIITLLGVMWFLQGIGFLTICPILCFADCECITGGSQFWAVLGSLTALCGLALVFLIYRGKI